MKIKNPSQKTKSVFLRPKPKLTHLLLRYVLLACLMGIILGLQLIAPLGQASSVNLVVPSVGRASQGDVSSIISSGQVTAATGTSMPHQAKGPVYSEIPGPAHEEEETAEEPTVPVPQGKVWETIPAPTVAAVEAPKRPEPKAPNDVTYQVLHDLTPAEVATSQRAAVHEPSIGNMGNTLFMSANWYAARSSDGGNTFTYVNPFTTFPSINGGFCCDQIVNYARNQDMMLWALQYSKDGSSGTLRIARAVGSAAVQNNSWIYYDFNPQNFGFAANTWMDFPNITVASTYLYCTSNVFDTVAGCPNCTFRGSVVWRIPLSELAAGGFINWSYFTRTDVGAPRCTEAATTTMYWATFANTSTLRIHRWDDSSSTVSWDNVALNAFTYLNRDGVSITPDGRNWAARADSRVLGATATGGVLTFMWGAKQDATFAQPYTIVGRFDQSTRALITQQPVFNPGFAFLYMNGSVNSVGAQAGLLSYGGGSLYPNTAFWINDDVESGFAPLHSYIAATSTAGPSGNVWGDFLTTRPHKDFTHSWTAVTYYMTAGGANSNTVGRYMWIGRQRDLPQACAPSPISFGQTINGNLSVLDCRSPARGGQYYADQYTFSGTAGQQIAVTLSSAAFDAYLYLKGTTGSIIAEDDDGGGGTNSRIPPGSGFLTIPTTGAYTIEATSFDQLTTGSYSLNLALAVSRTLTVASANPASGVSITVTPSDNNAQGSGVTQFTRVYNNNTNIALTAPSTAGGNNFQKWQLDGVDFTTSLLANFVMDANHTMTAVYTPPQTRTLTLASTNPTSGVSITVSPNDNNAQGSGVTQFTRVYNNNTNVSLTAPSTAGANAFQKWQLDGVDFTTSLLANLAMDANHTMTAVYATSGQTLLLDETFSAGIPATWSIVNGGSGGGTAATWTTANPGNRSIGGALFTAPFAIIDSDAAGQAATQDEQLITPAINASGCSGRVVVEFSNQLFWYDQGLNEVADLDVSTNGGSTWVNVHRMQGADNGYPIAVRKTIDITAAIGSNRSNVKIRFHYYNASFEFWWAIDDVKVKCVNGPPHYGSTTGIFRPSNGALYLKNSNTTGFADLVLTYGSAGDYPVAGDWNGDGVDTIGVYRNGTFYLRNTNTIGFADIVVQYGQAGDQPVVGDWDGDGVDTIGVFRNGTFLLRNSNTPGPADIVFGLGGPGDVGIAGDWDGDGIDTTGVYRPSNGALYLKFSNTTGFADLVLTYGSPGDKPVVGDWDGDGIDTIGIYRVDTFFLRNTNTNGVAEIVFTLGSNGDLPISGDWDGLP